LKVNAAEGEQKGTSVEWTTVQVLAVIFVATLIRSAFGFG
jgi:hypothetical protein